MSRTHGDSNINDSASCRKDEDSFTVSQNNKNDGGAHDVSQMSGAAGLLALPIDYNYNYMENQFRSTVLAAQPAEGQTAYVDPYIATDGQTHGSGSRGKAANRASQSKIADAFNNYQIGAAGSRDDGSFTGDQVEQYSMSSQTVSSEKGDIVTEMPRGLIGSDQKRHDLASLGDDPSSLHTEQFEIKQSSFEVENVMATSNKPQETTARKSKQRMSRQIRESNDNNSNMRAQPDVRNSSEQASEFTILRQPTLASLSNYHNNIQLSPPPLHRNRTSLPLHD